MARQIASEVTTYDGSSNVPVSAVITFADGAHLTVTYESGTAHVYDPEGGIQQAPLVDITVTNTSGEIGG